MEISKETNFYQPEVIQPVIYVTPIDNIDALVVLIEGEEYDKCEEYSHKRACNKKTGEWGKGMINKDGDPRKVERTGLLGEMAFSKIFGYPIDLTYREDGDRYDFIMPKVGTIDIKTASKFPHYRSGLIKAPYKKDRTLKKLPCDMYVFAYIDSEDIQNKKAKIVVVGGRLRRDIQKLPTVPARMGSHSNYEITYSTLNPTSKMLTIFKKLAPEIRSDLILTEDWHSFIMTYL